MKNKCYFMCVLALTSCMIGTGGGNDQDCEERPLTQKEKKFMKELNPKNDYMSISRIDYNYRDGYTYKDKFGNHCHGSNPYYEIYFGDIKLDLFRDSSSVLKKQAVEIISKLYSEVLEDSVIRALESYKITFRNADYALPRNEQEAVYELTTNKEAVENYVGFKVVRKNNKLIRKPIPKVKEMVFELDDFKKVKEPKKSSS